MNLIWPSRSNRRRDRKATVQLISLLAATVASTTASAQQEVPVVVNQQTGAQVELTRAYWNANVDIADRSIKCDYFRFNEESAVYEIYLTREYIHAPFLSTSVGSYVITDAAVDGFASWTVEDGIYSGVADFDSHEYLELVNYQTSSGVTSQESYNNAIRVWHGSTNSSPSAYSVCFDQSGTSFIPTGSADSGNTNLVVLDDLEDFSFQFPQPTDENHEVPVVYRDGERVTFVRGEWNYNEQLVNETVSCVENMSAYSEPDTTIWTSQTYLPHFGGDSVYFNQTYGDYDGLDQFTWSAPKNNIDLVGLFFSGKYMELTETGFNIYISTSRYFSCTGPTPKRVLALMPDSCDYSTADQFDGWGWNPIIQQGCPPLGITNDAMGEEDADEQVAFDTSQSGEQSSNVDNDDSAVTPGNGSASSMGEEGENEQDVSDTSVSVEQSDEGDGSQAVNNAVDDSSGTAGYDSTGTVSAEDQSNSTAITPEPTSGSGATDKFLLLFLTYLFGRKRSKIGGEYCSGRVAPNGNPIDESMR